MACDVVLHLIICNIVGITNTGITILINIPSSKINNTIYDPETFPRIILKGMGNCSSLVFASGKLVIAGAKLEEERNIGIFNTIIRIENCFV